MAYICSRCGKTIKAFETFIRCSYCGNRILIKQRPNIVKEVSTD